VTTLQWVHGPTLARVGVSLPAWRAAVVQAYCMAASSSLQACWHRRHGLCAHPAVRMHLGVPLALVPAAAAGGDARLQ
jgi:hypothetical protein